MSELTELRDKEMAVFEAEIAKATDSVYGILISHLYIEHLLDRYIRTKIKRDDGLLGQSGLSFASKLKLIRSFGEFDKQLVDGISKLNGIRNNCAHEFGHEISDKDVEMLGRTLGKDYRRILAQYPGAELGGIAPIVWNLCGRVAYQTLLAEGTRSA